MGRKEVGVMKMEKNHHIETGAMAAIVVWRFRFLAKHVRRAADIWVRNGSYSRRAALAALAMGGCLRLMPSYRDMSI